MTLDPAATGRCLDAIRARRPLIHNITNLVVTNTTANALLALGASPAMVTVSPTSFPIACRISVRTGSLCLPSPRAMNELRKGCPSILPLT